MMQESNEYSNVRSSGVEFTSTDALRALGIHIMGTEEIEDDLEAARRRGVDREKSICLPSSLPGESGRLNSWLKEL
jgi:hypothetical protein